MINSQPASNRGMIFGFSLVICLVFSCSPPDQKAADFDLVIIGGRVMDPDSGRDEVLNIGIAGGKISVLTSDSIVGQSYLDASGLVVAPGFVDLHQHGMTDETYGIMVRDGVTSAFELEVGTGDVTQWYGEREGGQYVNYGVSIGHIQVRMNVFEDPGEFLPSGSAITQVASKDQITELQAQIENGLAEGAVAVGFGLAYTPAATTEEFRAMLEIAAKHGASSHIHLRSGLDGINEAISTAREVGAPLHIVHINSSGGNQVGEYLRLIEEAREAGADVTTEAYPYEAGMTRIESALFDDWASWDEGRFGRYQWAETGEFLDRESFARYRDQGGGVIIHSRTEEQTLTAVTHPLTMIASDGFLSDGKGHPRTSGTYSKVLGKYVRELKEIPLMEALAKMTIHPAKRLAAYVPQMANKGSIQIGSDADIVIFDPALVQDQATYTDPTLPPVGIPFVIVNGLIVVENGELKADVRPGKAIRKVVD